MLNLALFMDSVREVHYLLEEKEDTKAALVELDQLESRLEQIESYQCRFCHELFEEWTDSLRHYETCQSILRNKGKGNSYAS